MHHPPPGETLARLTRCSPASPGFWPLVNHACNLFALIFALALLSPECNGDEFQSEIQPLLKKYCFECHSGNDAKGEIDFASLRSDQDIDAAFETWEQTAQRLIDREMPPDGELQPTESEKSKILDWYQRRFVESVQAKPGPFRPRRLCATEYRNTLRSLFGFDLEVAIIEAEQTEVEKSLVLKLLPDDPPGRSGFTNDTHGNPLSTVIWDQYSYLADHALDAFFAEQNRTHLEAYVGPIDGPLTRKHAETLIRTFVPRVHRRPVPEDELAKMIDRVQSDDPSQLVGWLKSELKAALMSPAFLYRGISMPRVDGQRPVDDFELAERLSYFLWSDMPDLRLSELAEAGRLHDEATLRGEVDRMLQSPKAKSLAEDFAHQWLALGEIEHTTDNYPLRQSLSAQATDFMHYLFTDDRPLLELIDSETTFINPLLAKFYPRDRNQIGGYRKPKGIEVEFVSHRKIRLDQTVGRGGILTMPGILAMNRGPVLRGTWMLERILGVHIPDPPMDVGVVPPNRGGEKLTFRQRFEQHRSNATCAVCHNKIDPLGFALQRYDDAGGYIAPGSRPPAKNRKKKQPSDDPVATKIDTSGKLPTGETFQDVEGLKRILTTSKRTEIIRNIVRRTLSYALCRKLEIHDQPVVDRIVAELDEADGSYRDLFGQIATSLPFRETEMGR